MPSPRTLRAHRIRAFEAQQGRCCYCGLPMWQSSPEELKHHGLRARTIAPLRCTAEHLLAKQDGGRDAAYNIAAACWLCNSRRHKRKSPPDPDVYREIVLGRLGKGKWHSSAVLVALGAPFNRNRRPGPTSDSARGQRPPGG